MEITQQTIEGELITVNFSYAALTQENQIFLRNTESVIKGAVDNIAKEFMTIGRSLLEAKERLPHGHFSQWVEGNLPFGERQAQALMNVARDPNANRYSLLGFNLSTQKQLAAPSTPEEVKQDIMAKAEAGAVITKEAVTKAVAEATTRFCPNCNGQQVIKAKANEHNNSVQCSNCKAHYAVKKWLTAKRPESWQHCTSCNRLWIVTSESPKATHYFGTYNEKDAKIMSCAGEADCSECAKKPKRYCPNCNHEARVRAGAGYFTTCIHCQMGHKYEEWLTEPCHVRYCRHCNEKRLIPLNCFEKAYFVKCKNKACGKEEKAGDWLIDKAPDWLLGDEPLELPPLIALQTYYCPNCGHEQQKISPFCTECKQSFAINAWLTTPPSRFCPNCLTENKMVGGAW